MLKAAIIGFGGIAQAHKNGYLKLEKEGKVKLVAAYDIRKEAFEKVAEINIKSDTTQKADFNCYTDLEEMLAKETLDFVDICVPTFLHKELAVKMLNKGYHVLCEKPMALNSEDCKEMLEAEKKSGKHLMIAQCLRFFPEYEYLKSVIDDGRYGKVISGFFQRLSPPPTWGWENWFMDGRKSGGCITDLHIHDIDIVRYLFGEPKSVSSCAVSSISYYDTVQTELHYGKLPITVIGDWALAKVPFSASYRVGFENATLICEKGKVTVYPKDGSEPFNPTVTGYDGYTGEIAYFCDIIEGKTQNSKNPATSAATTIRLIEVLRQSADRNGERVTFDI